MAEAEKKADPTGAFSVSSPPTSSEDGSLHSLVWHLHFPHIASATYLWASDNIFAFQVHSVLIPF